jgi:hypothetical protein
VAESRTFYHTQGTSRRDDGTIELHATWYDYEQDRASRTIGWAEITPSDPDYGLWRWVLSQGDRFGPIIGPDDLEAIREAYRAEGGTA